VPKKIVLFLQGKKTYLAAAALFALGIFGLWSGVLDGVVAASIIATSFGLVGLGAKATRHTQMVLDAIAALKQPAPLTAEQRQQLFGDLREVYEEVTEKPKQP